MKVSILTLLTLGLVLDGSHAAYCQQQPTVPPGQVIKQSQKKRCSLPQVLWQLGDKYNIYFTIEDLIGNPSTETRSMIWELAVYEPSIAVACSYLLERANDPTQELQAIHADLPDFQYAKDLLNPKIVHVFVTPLVNDPVYPLSKVIGPVQFQGTEAEFIYYLHRKGINVTLGLGAFDDTRDPRIYGPREANQLTVNLALQSATVREAISSFIPADSKERILWMAVIEATETVPPSTVFVAYGFHRYKGQIRKR